MDRAEELTAGVVGVRRRWRITGRTDIALSHGTQSYLVESPDPRGVKVLVTAKVPPANGNGHAAKRGKTSVYNHFQAGRVEQFM